MAFAIREKTLDQFYLSTIKKQFRPYLSDPKLSETECARIAQLCADAQSAVAQEFFNINPWVKKNCSEIAWLKGTLQNNHKLWSHKKKRESQYIDLVIHDQFCYDEIGAEDWARIARYLSVYEVQVKIPTRWDFEGQSAVCECNSYLTFSHTCYSRLNAPKKWTTFFEELEKAKKIPMGEKDPLE